jgi:hypothetical protein
MDNLTQQPYSPAPQMGMPQSPYHALILKMSKDMNFLGLMSIVFGVIATLTIIGAITGIPQIFAGIRLRESADAFKNFSVFNDPSQMQIAIEKQERYFYINKVLMIIALVLIALYIVFIILMLSVVGSGLFRNMNY